MSKVPGSAQEMLRSIHSSYRSGPISGSMYGHAFVPVRLGKDLYDEMSLVDYSMQVIFFSTLPIFTDPRGYRTYLCSRFSRTMVLRPFVMDLPQSIGRTRSAILFPGLDP